MKNMIQGISSLRGLLVFLVFFSHLISLPISLGWMLCLGKIGVVGFFLMAGYLAESSIKRRNYMQFAFNRFVRLYPVYWLLLISVFSISSTGDYSIKDFFLNMTLFHQFLGGKAIIGSSWMLSIMILFYFIVLICKENTYKRMNFSFYILCLGAISLGILRSFTGKPFPTAICLMTASGIIGYLWKINGKFNKNMICNIIIFEITLLFSAYLSYQELLPYYLLSYNCAYVLFYIFLRLNLHVVPLQNLGKLGFTFFLGAGIPLSFIGLFTDILKNLNIYVLVLLQFVLSICFSWIVTIYIEKPLIAYGKKKEKKIH